MSSIVTAFEYTRARYIVVLRSAFSLKSWFCNLLVLRLARGGILTAKQYSEYRFDKYTK